MTPAAEVSTNQQFQGDETRNGQEIGSNIEASYKVTVVGSGNWGSVAAKLIASNTLKLNSFHEEVKMWVYEETLPNRDKLTDVINQTNENVKYLPGIKLGKNVVVDPDIANAVKDANMLVFVTPHQFMEGICKRLEGKIQEEGVQALSLIKGSRCGGCRTMWNAEKRSGNWSRSCRWLGNGEEHEGSYYENCLREMKAFSKLMFPSVKDNTFFESCGIADVITTCLGGRNRRVSEAFARNGGKRSFEELEAELLQGKKLQGVSTAREVYEVLSHRGWQELFPLFTTVHKICIGLRPPSAIVEYSEHTPNFSLVEGSAEYY